MIPTKTLLLDDDPNTQALNENLIINSLIHVKAEGKAENTHKSIDRNLKQLSQHVNLAQPREVKNYIANAVNQKTKEPLSNATKKTLFCL